MPRTRSKKTAQGKTGTIAELTTTVNAALENGKLEEASDALRQMIRLNPDSPQTVTLAGLVALQLDQPTIAFEHFARAHKLAPDDASVNYNMALAAIGQKEYDQALVFFQRLRKLEPDNANLLNDQGVVWLYKGRPDRALASFSRAIKLDPNNSQARNNFLEFCLNNNLIDRARASLNRQETEANLTECSKAEIHRWQEILNDPTATSSVPVAEPMTSLKG
jgi:Flp pilus assembly protein TadD